MPNMLDGLLLGNAALALVANGVARPTRDKFAINGGLGSDGWTYNSEANELTLPGLLCVNVKDPPFKAAGDGSDDTAHILLAIETVAAAGGGEIYFPPGTYTVVASINYAAGITIPSSKITLRGAGKGVSTIKLSSSSSGNPLTIIRCYAEGETLEHIQILDLKIDGNRDGVSSDVIGVDMINCEHSTIEGCHITDCWHNDIEISGGGHNTVTRNLIENWGRAALPQGEPGGFGCILWGEPVAPGTSSPIIGDATHDNLVSNNVFNSLDTVGFAAITSDSGEDDDGQATYGNIISGNTIRDAYIGVDIQDSHHITVQHNKIYRARCIPISMRTAQAGIPGYSNKILDNLIAGQEIDETPVAPSAQGIKVGGQYGAEIRNNVLAGLGAVTYGIVVMKGESPEIFEGPSQRVLIQGNTIYSQVGDAIFVMSGNGHRVLDNIITSIASGNGIRAQNDEDSGAMADLDIRGNKISHVSGNGINITNANGKTGTAFTNVAISDNTVLNAGYGGSAHSKDGIYIVQYSGTIDRLSLARNHISDNQQTPTTNHGICFYNNTQVSARFVADTTLTDGIYGDPVSVSGGPWAIINGAYRSSYSWDPASMAPMTGQTSSSFGCAGARVGDTVTVSAPYNLTGVLAHAYVPSDGYVEINLFNFTANPVDLASGVWLVHVHPAALQ